MVSISGLRLPYISEPDPDLLGEGTLDPLGLAPIADRLADQIAPGLTARMFRVRFLTAMAVASPITEPFSDLAPGDGVSTPFLAFEWLLIEAFARDPEITEEAPFRIPGILKARSVVARKAHLDARSYLKTPKVFGFHGVYKRLAVALGILDQDLVLLPRGEELVRTWQEECGLTGYLEDQADTVGGALRRRVQEAVSSAYAAGSVQDSFKARHWKELTSSLRPDSAKPREKSLLFNRLTDPEQPIRRELILGVRSIDLSAAEEDVLRRIEATASAELSTRLRAIDAYERFAELLQTSFEFIQRRSTVSGLRPVGSGDLMDEALIKRVLSDLPDAYAKAFELLDPLGLGPMLEELFGKFAELGDNASLFDTLLEHHATVQREKPPGGKRPWFEQGQDGIVIRLEYRLDDEPEISGRYLHPYRIRAIQSFLGDLS